MCFCVLSFPFPSQYLPGFDTNLQWQNKLACLCKLFKKGKKWDFHKENENFLALLPDTDRVTKKWKRTKNWVSILAIWKSKHSQKNSKMLKSNFEIWHQNRQTLCSVHNGNNRQIGTKLAKFSLFADFGHSFHFAEIWAKLKVFVFKWRLRELESFLLSRGPKLSVVKKWIALFHSCFFQRLDSNFFTRVWLMRNI